MENVNKVLPKIVASHKIPLGTLVEVDIPYNSQHGIRGFVCEHTWDCDGEPMYAITLHPDLKQLEYIKSISYNLYKFAIQDGFVESSLKIIR
jgi:hypothetical protein